MTANVWCRAGGIRMAPRPVIPVATQQRLRRGRIARAWVVAACQR